MKELLKKFKAFMQSLTKEDIVGVLHHTDPDGVSSGVIMAKAVERLRGKKIDVRINQSGSDIPLLDETVKRLQQAKVNKLIITDLGVDQRPEPLHAIAQFADILIMDHHKIYHDVASVKITFLKPQMMDFARPAAYPAAKFCYDLAAEVVDMEDLDWIALIGVIGDCAYDQWKEFVDRVFAKYRLDKKPDIFATIPGQAASLISDTDAMGKEKVHEAFQVLYNAKDYAEVLSSKLQEYRDGVEGEITYWLEHVEDFAEFRDELELVFYFIKPRFGIRAPISTQLSLRHPHKTIIVVRDMDDEMLGISARRHDEKIAVNELLEQATADLKGANAGGHVPAAGGKIQRSDLGNFKENLLRLLRERHG